MPNKLPPNWDKEPAVGSYLTGLRERNSGPLTAHFPRRVLLVLEDDGLTLLALRRPGFQAGSACCIGCHCAGRPARTDVRSSKAALGD